MGVRYECCGKCGFGKRMTPEDAERERGARERERCIKGWKRWHSMERQDRDSDSDRDRSGGGRARERATDRGRERARERL